MRADQLLVERGLAASRSQAVRLIAGGLRWRELGGEWRTVVKNRDDIPVSAELELLDAAESRYVSRGGLKLEGALKAAKLDVTGKFCLDVGQSTGGFTDCLLQHGAAKVVGVDVGHGQLHERIRSDKRVQCLEKINARALETEDFFPVEIKAPKLAVYAKRKDRAYGAYLATGAYEVTYDESDEEDFDDEPQALDMPEVVEETPAIEHDAPQFDVIVGDLSFISLTLVLPAVVPFLAPEGRMLMLVKPQFELQPGQVGKGGIVRDESLYAFVEERIRTCLKELDLSVEQWMDSPIEGGDGNREFFVLARRVA